jgi:hypothetical protein
VLTVTATTTGHADGYRHAFLTAVALSSTGLFAAWMSRAHRPPTR